MFDHSNLGRHLLKQSKIANIFGTRPEIIKLMPIIKELECRSPQFDIHNIITWQHSDLLEPLLTLFDISVQHQLSIPRERNSLNDLLSTLVRELEPVLGTLTPDLVLVQGDTATALAGAISAFNHKIPVMHVEAGLRSGDRNSPFPEEMYRRMITQIATYHMAATPSNQRTLEAEGVPAERIYLTGNPVVDAVRRVLETTRPSAELEALLARLKDRRIIVLTTHRRENFGPVMRAHLSALREFVQRHKDVVLIFPVHPNPAVRAECARAGLGGPRMILIEPMIYPDFVHLLSAAWIVASDSGGVQEEVPTLGKALFILRENTERMEVVTSGFGRLVGSNPKQLENALEEVEQNDQLLRAVRSIENPFGRGDSAKLIVDAITEIVVENEIQKVSA